MEALVVAVIVAIEALLLAVVSRRLLAIPVGWTRALGVAALILLPGGKASEALMENLGMLDSTGRIGVSVSVTAALLVTALAFSWAVALGLGLLLILEILVPTGSIPDPISLIRDFPASVRRNRRYVSIVGIATRRGLGGFLGRGSRGRMANSSEVARTLRQALSDGGVTFVKLGQMLSTRGDLIGQEFADELSTLQSQVPPEPWSDIELTISEELGRPWREVFADLDQTPLAAASVGQVHAGHLHDGSDVVVKVQRRAARRQAEADLDIIVRLAEWLERRTTWGSRLGTLALARGFAESLEEELDYRVEAANIRAVQTTLPADSPIRTPRIYPEFSGRRLLVMERLAGAPLTRSGAQLATMPAAQRAALSQEMLKTILKQILHDGVFHADLHGGNVFLQPDGRLALIDFGAVGRLDSASRESLARMLLAISLDDAVAATDSLLQILDRPSGLRDRELERAVGTLVTRYRGGRSAGMFHELLSLAVGFGFAVPSALASVFRALGALEGTLQLLDSDFDLVVAAQTASSELGSERLTKEAIREDLLRQVGRLLPAAQRLPRQIDAIARQAQAGELTLRLRLLEDPQDRQFLSGLTHLITMSMITLAFTIVGMGLILGPIGPRILPGIGLGTALGATFLLLAFVLAARVLAAAFTTRP